MGDWTGPSGQAHRDLCCLRHPTAKNVFLLHRSAVTLGIKSIHSLRTIWWETQATTCDLQLLYVCIYIHISLQLRSVKSHCFQRRAKEERDIMKNSFRVYFFALYLVLVNSVSKCYICIHPYTNIYNTNGQDANVYPFTNVTAGHRVLSFIDLEYFCTSLCWIARTSIMASRHTFNVKKKLNCVCVFSCPGQ